MFDSNIDRICERLNNEIERCTEEIRKLDFAPSPQNQRDYNALRYRKSRLETELMTFQKSLLIVLSETYKNNNP